MLMERRDQQNSNLTHGTRPVCNDGNGGHELAAKEVGRWVRIGSRAARQETAFNNILTHINVDSLREAFNAQDGTKALGVDGISKKAYGKGLESNLKDLETRIQRGTYRPKAKKEILIPKADGKTRPISIACFEDKLVDWCVAKIITTIYEPMFITNSFGYRPGRSCDGAIRATHKAIGNNDRPYVVEIDFKSFFNTISHRKLTKILGKKIKDRGFMGLIGRFLEGEILHAQGETLPSMVGTPQGSIMSPVLANVYLNEVIDQWFVRKYGTYKNTMVRYADDGVFFFKKKEDAENFMADLRNRVQEFDLTLNEEKTKIVEMTKKTAGQFNFLGMTFYWGKLGSRRGLKVKTQKEKLIRGIAELHSWVKANRNKLKLKDLWRIAKSKITGHMNYYGYLMNVPKLNHFYREAVLALFKWINRRSQKRSYTWEGFAERLKNLPLMESLDKQKLKQLGWDPYAISK
jgi:RNA-directed DNA polymerase